MKKPGSPGTRSRARELIVQSLYQMQITGHDKDELLRQFHGRPDYERVDKDYYDNALSEICEHLEDIEKNLQQFADRPLSQLDPVERSVLLLGIYELQSSHDVPFKVVVNEAVNLARRFGAVDGHKYVNAVLDRAGQTLRPAV